jgi:hypothetical protein
MEPHLGNRLHQCLAVRAELIVGVAEQMVDCRLGILERARTAIDEPGEIARYQRGGQQRRVPFALSFLQELGKGERQVDDQLAAQGADTLVRTENDDLHCMSSCV